MRILFEASALRDDKILAKKFSLQLVRFMIYSIIMLLGSRLFKNINFI
jgi:hypothetical protein